MKKLKIFNKRKPEYYIDLVYDEDRDISLVLCNGKGEIVTTILYFNENTGEFTICEGVNGDALNAVGIGYDADYGTAKFSHPFSIDA